MTRSSSRTAAAAIVLVALAISPLAHADTKDEARVRFARAIALVDEGDLDRALAEFQRAYDLVPNPRVLLNVAEAEAALGRPAAAVTSLDKLLAAPAGTTPDELARAKALRAREAAKVAELRITSNVAGARIDVDNLFVAETPTREPLRVASGSRVVSVIAAGYAPLRKTIVLAGGASETVNFELVPLEARLAHVALKTNLPGAELRANGERVATTPLTTTLTFAPGHYRFELARDGYTTATAELELGEGATGELRLEPELDPRALEGHSGVIELAPSEPGAAAYVDGRALGVTTSISLPLGAHALRVAKAGFLPYERNVTLAGDKPLRLAPYLEPTLETRADYEHSAQRTRTLGWALVGGGGVVLATSAVLAIVFTNQRSNAQDSYNATVKSSEAQKASTGNCDEVCLATFTAASDKLDDEKRWQTVSFIGLGVGAVVTAAGIYFLLTGDDPHRYDRPRATLRPTFGGLAGTF